MRLLSKKQTRELVGIGFTQMARLEAVGRFPKRVRVGFRVFYVEVEILDWIRERVSERD
jgi:prophage regulatory protein